MSFRIRNLRTVSIAALAAMAATICTVPAAHAESSSTKCTPTYVWPIGDGYQCPLWHAAPVYLDWSTDTKIGSLPAGSANFFRYQCMGQTLYTLGYHNFWWASVRLSDGRWGFVNEVYFKGGGNDERDGGLAVSHYRSTLWC